MSIRLKLLAILIVIAAFGIIAFQLSWLKSSYKVSREKIIVDAGRVLDESILEHKRKVADHVRILLKQAIRPQDIITKVLYKSPRREYAEVGFRSKRRKDGSWLGYKIPVESLEATQDQPYSHVLNDIESANLNRLKTIYSSFVGTVDYAPDGWENKLQDSLMRCFYLHQDTATLNLIVKQKLVASNLRTNSEIIYFKRITDIYNGPSKLQQAMGEAQEIIEVDIASRQGSTLTADLDSINAHMTRLNQSSVSVYIAKPILDDINSIVMEEVPIIILQLDTPSFYIIKQILIEVISSAVLMLLICFCLSYMFYFILKQKKLAKMKDDFMANVSHELKTPVATTLAAIQGMQYFEILKDPEKTEQYLSTAAHQMQRLSFMIDTILHNVHLRKAGFALHPSTFNFKEALQEMISTQERHAKKLVSIRLNYRAKEIITADRTHLYNVMVNLVDNAIKYSSDEVIIEISVEPRTTGIGILINDNGIGIPSQYKQHVFDQFFRVPKPNDHRIKGYGLGLNYVKEIVEKHGGKVILRSSGSTGSTFEIELPQ